MLTAWIERRLIGAEGADFELTFIQRCLLAERVIWFYLSKLAWPAELVFIYPRWTIDPMQLWLWIFPTAMIAVTGAVWMIRKRWRTPLAGWLFFCGTLFPVLGFLNVYPFIYSFVADHFQYLASLGIIVPVAGAATVVAGRLPGWARPVAALALTGLVGVLAILSWRQAIYMRMNYRSIERRLIVIRTAGWRTSIWHRCLLGKVALRMRSTKFRRRLRYGRMSQRRCTI